MENCGNPYGGPGYSLPPLPADNLRFSGVPKTFMARRKSSTSQRYNDPDHLESVLNPGPSGHAIKSRQRMTANNLQAGRGNRLKKSTHMFTSSNHSKIRSNSRTTPSNVGQFGTLNNPPNAGFPKPSISEDLGNRYDYDDMAEEEFQTFMNSKSGKSVQERMQPKSLDLLAQFDSAVNKPSIHRSQNVLQNVKKIKPTSSTSNFGRSSSSSMRSTSVPKYKGLGANSTIDRNEIKERVEKMKKEIMAEIGCGVGSEERLVSLELDRFVQRRL